MSLKISIIVPVYNVEKYIEQCVDSIINQTYRNIEVILVDDGSPDNSPKICDKYAELDERVVVIHKKNGGLSDARNAGINLVTGDYIWFVDGDDLLPDKQVLSNLVNRLNITKPDLLNFPYEKYYESSDKRLCPFTNTKTMPIDLGTKDRQIDYICKKNLYIASACNKIISADIVRKNGIFNVGVLSEDIDWAARILCAAQSVDYFNYVGYTYRQREGSITHTMKEKSCVDLQNAIIKCIEVIKEADSNTKEGLYYYTAYQLSTFVAVQAIAESCSTAIINNLTKYNWILKYYGNSKKVKILYIFSSIFGFKNLCKCIRITKRLWRR